MIKPSIDAWVAGAPKPLRLSAIPRLSSRQQWALFYLALLIGDFLMIGLAFRAAFLVRFETTLPVFNLDVVPSFFFYQRLAIIFIPLWIGIFWVIGLYNRENLLGGTLEYANVFRASTMAMLLVVIIGFLDPVFIFARGWLVLAWGFTFLFAAAGRFILRRAVYSLRMRGYFLSPALIIGANDEGRLLAEQLTGWRRSGLYVIGFIDDQFQPGTPIFKEMRVLGGLGFIDEVVRRFQVRELILATSAMNRENMLEVFRRFGVSKNVTLRLSSGLFEIITTGLQVKELAYVPLVRVNKARLTGADRVLKWLLDYAITVPALVLLLPAFGLLAILIRLDSPGPILHRRRVMGLNGTQFDAFKFRTMHENGDEILSNLPGLQQELALNQKLVDDPRVTRLGRFLRKTSVDELPQFINVLRREMSLVGPRMISPPEMVNYNQWGINLLTVRPGITGLWQVSGRSDVAYEKRVRLDMQYIRNWSIWLDLYILLQTIPAVLKGRGAY